MALTYFRSDDASAPVLDGEAGSLITVLDALLVNGYGGKTALGFAKEFSGTDKAAYRAASGNRMRLRVDDSSGNEARVVGYETMSDVDTGTGPFPTNVQQSGGLYARKSSTSNDTARPWVALGDSTWFVILMFAAQDNIGETSTSDGGFFFGECESKSNGVDDFNTVLMAPRLSGASRGVIGGRESGASNAAALDGHYMPRGYTQAGSSIEVGKCDVTLYGTATNDAIGGANYPDTNITEIGGELSLSEIRIMEEVSAGNWEPRCLLPAMRAPQHNLPYDLFDTFSGVGALAGKTFVLVPVNNAGTVGRMAWEIP